MESKDLSKIFSQSLICSIDDAYQDPTPPKGRIVSDTPIKLINCPICGTPVNSPFLEEHKKRHENKPIASAVNSSYTFPKESMLLNKYTLSTYSNRWVYTSEYLTMKQ